MRISRCDLILVLCSGLCFTAIALLSEGKVEIVAQDTDPIERLIVRVALSPFLLGLFDRCEIVAHLNRIIN